MMLSLLLAATLLTSQGDLELQAPRVPGVDWTRAAVAGYFTSPDPWGLEACAIEAQRVADGWRIRTGSGWGTVALEQRFVGCIRGTKVPIFQ
jgi:hypothetical protein